MPTRKQPASQDPEPNQDLPETPDPVEPNQDLPEAPDENPQPPPGQDPDKVRGKSEDARGHNKPEHREDPNSYPDPDFPPRTP